MGTSTEQELLENRELEVEVMPPAPAPTAATGTLMAHAGAERITRVELALVPTPPESDTFKPVPHVAIVEALEQSLSFRGISVVRQEYAVTPDGMRMFGIVEIDIEETDLRFSIGLRNAHDKSMRLGMVAGYRVFVCDNMAFAGEFSPLLAKHSKNFQLQDSVAVGVERIQRHFDPLRARINSWKQKELPQAFARKIFLDCLFEGAFTKEVVKQAHDFYFEPESYSDSRLQAEFADPTMWSLSNAFTYSFKGLAGVKGYEAAAKLGKFLERY